MMWLLLSLMSAALTVESYVVHDTSERLSHGRQLKIYLPKSTEKLVFVPIDNPAEVLYWDKRWSSRVTRGRVSGTGNDRRWYLDQVTFDDQGTYIQKDFWDKEISILKVAVLEKNNYIKRIAGESLYVSLEGIGEMDATLRFSGEHANQTLVRDGALVSQDIPDYWDRLRIHTKNIEIRNVNYTDVGRYYLYDRKNRLVSITRMDLTDHHDYSEGNPLMALLLLLGIPAGICCCCRKKIFKSKANTASTQQASPGVAVPLPSGPVGPCPPYHNPQQPGGAYYPMPSPGMASTVHPPPPVAGPGQWNGPPPSPGMNPGYPPQNPAYPPVAPGPQWSGPPPGQYPPGPGGPMGYAPAPVMYSSPAPPANEEIKMENLASSPAQPLLNAESQASTEPVPPVPPSTTNVLSDSDAAATFQIDKDKNTSNFL
ncbi:uncharacterized protein LOC115418832 [Sphaeramia orbicularis]|uniref:uncharacterized protein LOC115418832 n=1 Tax=Sphaeramia orbicularis TaxID=375764 RepID=UPI00117F1CC8|nr:uncharacterized protein LOC115418832 [Sphaeramia orbicularis]